MGSPSGRVPEQGPDWFFVALEVCSGGTPDIYSILEVFGYVGIYGCRKYVGGATGVPRGRGRAPTLVTASLTPWSRVQVSWITFGEKITFPKVSFRLASV